MIKTVLLFALTAAAVGCGASPYPQFAAGSQLTEDTRIAVKNLHQVTDNLYRSGHLNASDMDELKQLGITKIISLEDYDPSAAEQEQTAAVARGIDFKWMPMDSYDKPTVEQIESTHEEIRANEGGKTLVHCFRGSDRTGITVAAWRMVEQQWTKQRAVTELRSLGHTRVLYWWDDVLDHFE
jgi:protein tyrosine/serine phosphatase